MYLHIKFKLSATQNTKYQRVDKRQINTYNICMWKISKHALERIQERGFTKEDVLLILNSKSPVSLIFKSPVDDDVEIYMGFSGEKHLMIPVNTKTKNVITVRPMRRQERIEFEKRIKE